MGCCCSSKAVAAQEAKHKRLNEVTAAGGGPQPEAIGKTGGSKAAPTKTKTCNPEVLKGKLDQAAKTRTLALRECGLKQLPADATRDALATLTTADLSTNQLSSLPASIATWVELKLLNASDNNLERLPDQVGDLLKLQKLSLSRNKLQVLPLGLGGLPLTELKCDQNMLPAIPDIFGGPLVNTLVELDISGNRLRELPASICHLRLLARLLVQRNQLTALPLESVGGDSSTLSRLQHVDAAENNIASINPGTLRLPSLSELWLKGNPIDRLELQKVDGFNEFAERRKQKLDKKIDQNVVGEVELAMCGL